MENFVMKCQTVIVIHYFWHSSMISVHTFLNARKSQGGCAKNSVISSLLKWVQFYVATKCTWKRRTGLTLFYFVLKFPTVSEKLARLWDTVWNIEVPYRAHCRAHFIRITDFRIHESTVLYNCALVSFVFRRMMMLMMSADAGWLHWRVFTSFINTL